MRSLAVDAAGLRFSAAGASAVSAFTMSLHFQLHQLGRIAAGVAGGAEFTLGVLDGGAQRGKRKIAERIRAEEFADLFDGIVRSDELFAARRIDAVIAGRNRRRTAD